MSNKLSVRHLIFYVSILIILVSFGYYTSYAFFSTVVEGNEDATKTEITLANIETTFETTSYINNERLIPILPAEVDEKAKKVEFTVTNTANSDIAVEYDIYLEDFVISDNFASSEDLRYKLTKLESGTEVLVAEGNFTESTSGEKFKLTTTKETLNYNTSRDYILRLWIHDTGESQPNLLEGTISGKVSVIGKIYREPAPTTPKKCKRATTLHTTTCSNNSDYVCKDTVGNGAIITYGNLGTSGTLASGDAFDCDVNGDGTYDEETERFYYVSDLYTGTVDGVDIYDTNYAVLIYYSNTIIDGNNVTQDNVTGVAYDSSYRDNHQGPGIALEHIPSTTQWSNISLKNQTRQIYNRSGATFNTYNGTNFPLPQFTYTNKAARLLTHQEIKQACNIIVSNITEGELDTCTYLMENTRYENISNIYGYWLETAGYYSYTVGAWRVYGGARSLGQRTVNDTSVCGVRPAIEVLKTDMTY